MSFITDPGRPVVEGDTSSTVDSAALARLHDYMRRAICPTEGEVIAARDAYVEGFRMGARWGVRTTSRLADPAFRQAVHVLAELLFGADQ